MKVVRKARPVFNLTPFILFIEYFTMMTIEAVTGSLDSESYTIKLVKCIKFFAPEFIKFKVLDISRLPYVAWNFEYALSSSLKELYDEIEAADRFTIARAEYKRAYSLVIINSLDLNADDKSKLEGKRVSVCECTPDGLNATGGIGMLEDALEELHIEVYNKPDFYFCDSKRKFDKDGMSTDQVTSNVIKGLWDIFEKSIAQWRIERKLNR